MPLDLTYLEANDETQEAALMHVTNSRSIGATTIAVDTVAGVPSKFIATTGPLLANGFIDPANATNFYGHLSGSDLEIDGFLPGSSDVGNNTSDVVVIRPSGFATNLIAVALNNIMESDGSALGNDVVDTAQIADSAVTNPKIDDGSVTNAKLSTSAGEPNGGWVDYSSSIAVDGWSGTPTKSFFALKVGRVVFYWFSVSGTSNAGHARIVLPVAIDPDTSQTQTFYGLRVVDNGGTPSISSQAYISSGEKRFNISKDLTGTTFTASGTKSVAHRGWYLAAA